MLHATPPDDPSRGPSRDRRGCKPPRSAVRPTRTGEDHGTPGHRRRHNRSTWSRPSSDTDAGDKDRRPTWAEALPVRAGVDDPGGLLSIRDLDGGSGMVGVMDDPDQLRVVPLPRVVVALEDDPLDSNRPAPDISKTSRSPCLRTRGQPGSGSSFPSARAAIFRTASRSWTRAAASVAAFFSARRLLPNMKSLRSRPTINRETIRAR
jgi:hypothetical protein